MAARRVYVHSSRHSLDTYVELFTGRTALLRFSPRISET